ncbi:hypothetical protein BV22DRAFT_1000347 [Leucogyrophana mollusca]|uniref:Uncharacterized protein n=1 Tax=Leucogyrophana mollusca TaxID=85980 RepID=A0ACB8BXZ9_9AGAM|nr:hypothetical protein BV22DRAFT_1000347 [Leucogyrophana mollusca]
MQSIGALPGFLDPLPNPNSLLPYIKAVFPGTDVLGPAHVHWWPCREHQLPPKRVFLFIPGNHGRSGNPGLVDFYPPFLSAIHNKDESGRLAILSHSHIGHTPALQVQQSRDGNTPQCGLPFQVQNALRIFDAVKSSFGLDTNVILAGHSVGAWIALQVLKARPESVSGIFLLFPTIADIAMTPNGRKLSWAFVSPIPRITAALSRVLVVLPFSVLRRLFPSYPLEQAYVLQSLLRSAKVIYATMTMAHDEMKTIRDLDVATLNAHQHRIYLYFAENDDWVGEQREVILKAFESDPGSVRVVHGHRDIPHAFCINHGEELASQCHAWLSSGELC